MQRSPLRNWKVDAPKADCTWCSSRLIKQANCWGKVKSPGCYHWVRAPPTSSWSLLVCTCFDNLWICALLWKNISLMEPVCHTAHVSQHKQTGMLDITIDAHFHVLDGLQIRDCIQSSCVSPVTPWFSFVLNPSPSRQAVHFFLLSYPPPPLLEK